MMVKRRQKRKKDPLLLPRGQDLIPPLLQQQNIQNRVLSHVPSAIKRSQDRER